MLVKEKLLLLLLPQTPEDDHRQGYGWVWKADGSVTVGAWVLIFIAMVGWMGAVMEV